MALVSYGSSRAWGYSSVVLYVLLTLDALYFIYKFPLCRTRIGLSAVVASVGGLIYSLINSGILVSSVVSAISALFAFIGIFNAFTFLPGVIALHNMSKERKSELGTFFGYIGFGWTVITLVVSLLITIFTAINFDEEDYFFLDMVIISFTYSNWVYIGIYLVYIPLHTTKLDQRARLSILSYIGLLGFYMVAYTISSIINVELFSAPRILSFWLVSLPMAISILIAIMFGNTWNLGPPGNNVNEDIESVNAEDKSE